MKMQLDRDALFALFPEGSEARIELQRVVAHALVEKLAIKDVKFLDGQIEAMVKALIKSSLAEFGVQETWNRRLEVSTKLIDHVKKIVRDQCDRAIHQAILDSLNEPILEKVQQEIRHYLTNRLETLMTTDLNDHIRAITKQTLKNLLGTQ